jgi:hypothetical protein
LATTRGDVFGTYFFFEHLLVSLNLLQSLVFLLQILFKTDDCAVPDLGNLAQFSGPFCLLSINVPALLTP